MKLRVDNSSPTKIKVDALIGGVFKGGKIDDTLATVDKALDGSLSDILKQKEFHGRRYETDSLLSLGKLAARRVLLVGIGKEADYDLYYLRNVVAAAARAAHKKGARSLAFIMPTPAGAGAADVAQAIVEGAMLGLVNPDIYKTAERDADSDVEELVIVGAGGTDVDEAVKRGQILAEAANFTRSLAEEPANIMTPVRLAEEARRMCQQHGNLEFNVLGRAEMEAKGMGSILGVAAGSHTEPQMIVISYNGGKGDKRKIALVGKGITFDSGGTSIKGAADMHYMKYDMCGAAAVIGAMKAIAELAPAINVIAIACAVENMPGGGAQRPGDVRKAMNGTSIEVLNTDAEGRLVLADGVLYAQEQGATHVVDICTLTGAAVISLGHAAAALLGRPQAFLDQVKEAGEESGERIWQLPLFSEYREQLKSNIADIANVGGRAAGTAVGAIFVGEFIEDATAWAHLDIAAVAYTERDLPYLPQGSSGYGVRTMTNLVLDVANSKRDLSRPTLFIQHDLRRVAARRFLFCPFNQTSVRIINNPHHPGPRVAGQNWPNPHNLELYRLHLLLDHRFHLFDFIGIVHPAEDDVGRLACDIVLQYFPQPLIRLLLVAYPLQRLHLTILYLKQRLDIQQPAHERRASTDTPTAPQIFQRVQGQNNVHLRDHRLDYLHNFVPALALGCRLRRPLHHEPQAHVDI